MKKFELLGRSLSKDQQKRIKGGDEEVGCSENSSCCVKTCKDGHTESSNTCYTQNVCDSHGGEKDCVCG